MEMIKPLIVGGTCSNIYIASPRRFIGIGNSPTTDRFELNSVGKFTSENFIRNRTISSPEIKKILRETGVSPVLNMEELTELMRGHASDTKRIVSEIVTCLPPSLKSQADIKALREAAYFHDVGKVLIPKEILNKPAKLTPREFAVMQRHSELSYELLKESGLSEKVLKLIKYHHQNPAGNAYPEVPKDFVADINLQILSLADKFSALKEKRPYKEPLSTKEALTILYNEVRNGNIHPQVFNALVSAENQKAVCKIL